MPKDHKSTERNKPMTNETFGPTPSESAQHVQQKKAKQTTNKQSKRTKWSPFPVELQTASANEQKLGRNRRRRKHKSSGGSRCRKPASPSLASTCSSNSIISSSSGLGSMGSSAITTLNGTRDDTISTPTLPSSGCSSIGFSDDKYEDLVSERDSEIAEEETESCAETINDVDLAAAVSIGLDLTNPAVQQFYQEQRIIYRQFYERQFSTMACIPYSPADSYCSLTSQFSHCNIQPNRSSRQPKHSNRNGPKYDQPRKQRPNRPQNEIKQRVFYNSSNRQQNDSTKISSQTTPQQHCFEIAPQQEKEKACCSSVEQDESFVSTVDENRSLADEMKDVGSKKDHGHRRDLNSNINDRYPISYKKQHDQRRNGHKLSHQQHQNDKDKKEIDWKKLTETLDPLSAQIFKFQKSIEQTSSSLCEKLYLRDLLYCAIAPHFIGCGLYIVGSTLNGFGSGSSDMDLCLMITPQELDQRVDAVMVLSTAMNHLKNLPWVDNTEIIFAKVPILRATFKAPFDKIVVDLNANNAVAIRNTHLLCYYSGFDWRVRPLVCVIKEWAKRRGINNANQSSLTSYSLVLMAIHYLQCGVKAPILPSLQQVYHNRFNAKIDVRNLDISYPLEQNRNWENSKNLMSLSELLKGFFNYYAYDFDFDNSAISVRLGRVVERAFVVSQHRNHFHALAQWRCICIEEPFSLSNAAHSVYDERVFAAIKESFKQASIDLERDGNLDSLLSTEPIPSPTSDLFQLS